MSSNKINFLFYALGIAISGILSFVFIPVVVQMCGKETYATYSMLLNTLSVVCLFCYAWVGQSFIRFYSQKNAQLEFVSFSLLNKSLFLGFICFILLCLVVKPASYFECLFFTPTFFLFGYYCYYLLVYQAKQKALTIMICEVLRTLINIVVAFFALQLFKEIKPIYILSISLLLSYAIPLLILRLLNSNTNKESPNEIEYAKVQKQLLQFGIPIALFLSSSLALSINDRFLISYFVDKKTAGTYAAIYDVISKGVVAIFSPILMTFNPIITKLYNDGNTRLAAQKTNKLIWIEGLLIIAGFIILVFFSPVLLKLIFKQPALQSLVWSTCLIFIGVCLLQIAMLVHKPIELKQKTKFMAISAFIAFLVNISLNFLLIKYNPSLIVPSITTIVGSVVYIILIVIFNKNS